MRSLLLSAVLSVAASSALAVELPLQRGFYIDERTSCGSASNASLYLLTRDSLRSGGNSICTFTSIKKVGLEAFHTEDDCNDGPSGLHEWIIPTAKEFSRFGPGYELYLIYCPQEALPAPWRNNDIRAHIR